MKRIVSEPINRHTPREEIKKKAIAFFELLHGRKATPKELEEFDEVFSKPKPSK